MSDGYLSRDRAHLAELQRKRRARMTRIDYMPNLLALSVIGGRQAEQRQGSLAATNSAVIDAIVTDWARLTAPNKSEVVRPQSPRALPELCDRYARARETSEDKRPARARVRGVARN